MTNIIKDENKQLLLDLRTEHRALDDQISKLSEKMPMDQLELQRLKREKLRLKDQIQKLEDGLFPDIIA